MSERCLCALFWRFGSAPTWDSSAALRPLVQWPRGALTRRLPIGPPAPSLSFTRQRCQSIPRGVKRWQMPVLLGPLPVNRAWNGCLISFEWLFSPVQTICYHHVVMRAYIKQRKKGSMQTVVTLQPVVFLYIWAYVTSRQKALVYLYHRGQSTRSNIRHDIKFVLYRYVFCFHKAEMWHLTACVYVATNYVCFSVVKQKRQHHIHTAANENHIISDLSKVLHAFKAAKLATDACEIFTHIQDVIVYNSGELNYGYNKSGKALQ